jgi:hypothetical protein
MNQPCLNEKDGKKNTTWIPDTFYKFVGEKCREDVCAPPGTINVDHIP